MTIQSQFVDRYAGHATRASNALGIPAEYILGQWALETGWGQHFAGRYNVGNIQGSAASPHSYASIDDGVNAYISTLQNPRYAQVLEATTATAFGLYLKFAGYAADPLYAKKIADTIRQVSGVAGDSGSMRDTGIDTDNDDASILDRAFSGFGDAISGIGDSVYNYMIFGAAILLLGLLVYKRA